MKRAVIRWDDNGFISCEDLIRTFNKLGVPIWATYDKDSNWKLILTKIQQKQFNKKFKKFYGVKHKRAERRRR